MAERAAEVQRSQEQLRGSVGALESGLVALHERVRTVEQSGTAVGQRIAEAQQALAQLETRGVARQDVEQRTADSVRRIEALIAGTQSKGAAGEHILDDAFALLPAEWKVRNLRVGDRVVEFALRLPNGQLLPIDSKWPATALVEQLTTLESAADRIRVRGQIEDVVRARAREVRKYLDPKITADFGIAALPDAVYSLCGGVHAECFEMQVLLVPYSMFLPYLLLVFHTVSKSSQSLDTTKLSSYLAGAQQSLSALQEEMNGRFSRAITMLTNGREDIGVQLSKLRAGLAGMQASATLDTEHPQATQPALETPRTAG